MIKHIKQDRLHSLAEMLESNSESAAARIGATARRLNGRQRSTESHAWTPPKRVLGTVQTVLRLLVSMSIWLVGGALKHRMDVLHLTRLAFGTWFAQLAVNLAWSGGFMVVRRFGAGLYVIGGLLPAMAAYMVWAARISKLATWLLAPYLAWVSIAAAINLQFWKLNRGVVSQLLRR